MEWYKTLDIHQKINLKEHCNLLVGITFENMRVLFTLPEIINLLYYKLKLEGFKI